MTSSGAVALALAFLIPTSTAVPASPGPSTSPSASPSPRPPLKVIVTVKSTPYCSALAEHFNGAMAPIHGNDLAYDKVDVELDDMNDMFKHPNYIDRFIVIRTKLEKEVDGVGASLKSIQSQIDQLRASATLSNDPAEQQQMRDAAIKLSNVYQRQFELWNDLQALVHSMMEYDIFSGDHPLNGWTLEEAQLPKDRKDIKDYLRFDRSRKYISDNEDAAVDIAYSIATDHCTNDTPTSSPSPH
jgi:hypothetical protein